MWLSPASPGGTAPPAPPPAAPGWSGAQGLGKGAVFGSVPAAPSAVLGACRPQNNVSQADDFKDQQVTVLLTPIMACWLA